MYLDNDKSSKNIFDFNQFGYLIKQSIFDKSDEIVNEYYFRYNIEGDQIARKKIRYHPNQTDSLVFTKFMKLVS